MEQRIEQLEKTISTLQEEIRALKQLVTAGFERADSNFKNIGINVGVKPTKLTQEKRLVHNSL